MNFYHPDMCWLRRAILMSLLSHPFVKQSKIYYPTIDKVKGELIKIQRGRLFGGPELVEQGLTLAVYPYHSDYDIIKGAPPSALSTCSVHYPSPDNNRKDWRTTLGSTDPNQHSFHASIRLVVQLYYRDAQYDTPIELKAEYVDQDKTRKNEPFGYNFQYKDLMSSTYPDLKDTADYFVEESKFNVQVLPAEEILTQWLDVIKFAIRDQKTYLPYPQIRNPYIIYSDYPSSTWSTVSANLVFHTAFHIVEFTVSEPSSAPKYIFPNVQNVNLSLIN